MKLYPLLSLSCFLFVAELAFLQGTCRIALAFEGSTAASSITTQEAKQIWLVEHLVAKYSAATTLSSKSRFLEDLKKLYSGTRGTFLEVIVINALLEIDQLGTEVEQASTPTNTFLDFARSIAGGTSTVSRFLGKVEDPGQEQFLRTWLLFREHKDTIGDETPSLARQGLINGARIRIAAEIKDKSSAARVSRLVRCLGEFEAVHEYEACITLLIKEHEVTPELVVSEIQALVIDRLPRSKPPPYSRDHTVVYIVCTVAKTLNDASLLGFLENLEESENPYVSEQASVALLWMRKNVKYPFRYHELWRSYWSRS